MGGSVGQKEWISIALSSDSDDHTTGWFGVRRLMSARRLIGIRRPIGVKRPIGVRHPVSVRCPTRNKNRRFHRLFGSANRHDFFVAWRGAIGPNPLRWMEVTWPNLKSSASNHQVEEGPRCRHVSRSGRSSLVVPSSQPSGGTIYTGSLAFGFSLSKLTVETLLESGPLPQVTVPLVLYFLPCFLLFHS